MNKHTNVVDLAAHRAAKTAPAKKTRARRLAVAAPRLTLEQSIHRDVVRQRASAAL